MNGVPEPLSAVGDRRRSVAGAEIDIEHGNIDGALGDELRRLICVVRRTDDGAAGLLEDIDKNHCDKRLVLEDQHALACQHVCHARFSNGSASSQRKPVLG